MSDQKVRVQEWTKQVVDLTTQLRAAKSTIADLTARLAQAERERDEARASHRALQNSMRP